MCNLLSHFNLLLWGKNSPIQERESEEDFVLEENEETEEEICSETEEITVEEYKYNGMTILLDCGHAEKTPGKRSLQKEDGSQFFEYISNREIGKLIARKLDTLGICYHFVEDLEDPNDKGLTARANTANDYCAKYGAKNCLFISLHSNACGNGDWVENARGWSIYTTKGTTNSDKYATIFYEEAEKVFPQFGMTLRKDMSDGDPDYEENFTVIYKTLCPSVLIEAFFYTSHEDLAFLESEEGKNACADVVVNGIKRICC